MRLYRSIACLSLLALLAGCGSGSSGASGPPVPAVAVTLAPASASLATGQSQAFTATVTGTTNAAVTWSVVEGGGGTVSGGGLYTAPSVAGTYHVKATSVADPGRSAQAVVTVSLAPPVIASFTASPATITAGQSCTLAWSVSGASSLNLSGIGTVSGGSLVVRPASTTTYTLTAVNAGGTASATTTVTVNPLPLVAVTVSPATAALQTGQSQAFTVTVTGTANTAVTWSVLEAGGGSVTGGGLYTAPGTPGTFHVRATSAADPARSAEATVTVTAPPRVTVTVSPATATLQTGQSQAFTATVTGSANTAVTWSVAEAGGGTVDAAGLYSAPAMAGTFHVRATSAADPARSAEATVTVTAPPRVTVTVSPATAALQTGQSQAFTATVTGSANTAVTWGVAEAGGGTVDGAGLYTAPATPGTFHVRATSAADPAAYGEAELSVTAVPTTHAYLYLSEARLAQIRAEAQAGKPAWAALRQNVEDNLASTDEYDIGPENLALAYLVGGDARYAARAFGWAQQRMALNLSRDSYYDFGEILEGVALVLNYCAPALSPAEAETLAGFLDAAADELWYHNQGSGWGLDNPRNNYHHNFLMGTAYAGYALRARGDARGDRWVAKVDALLQGPGGVLAYLNTGVPGGDWDEGVNYAEGSKMHLARTLALVAAGGGGNHFAASPFFANLPRFTLYAIQPGGRFLYPGGDLARDSSMPLSPYDRALMQPVVFWLPDGEGRRLGQWFLNHRMPTYLDGDHSFSLRTGLWMEVLWGLDLPETGPAALPLSYRTPTTNWVNLRSGWDDQAASLTISGAPRILESHQHMDTGSFTFWQGGWQAADASSYSHSGLLMDASAHNLLRVPHAQWNTDEVVQVPGLRKFGDYGGLAYVQVDSTRLYRWLVSSEDIRDLLDEHTREFVYLRPGTLVVFDRVAARPDGLGYAWCLHTPDAPAAGPGGHTANHQGGGLSLVKLVGGTTTVVSDTDLEAGTTSFRIEEAASGAVSRFLNVLEVGSPAAPAPSAQLLASSAAVRAVLVRGSVVVFSDAALGTPAALPFSYTVPGTASLPHLLCNLGGPVNASAAVVAGNTVVTVSAGGGHVPDSNGVLLTTLAPH